jgi:Ca2+ transporting ATPase
VRYNDASLSTVTSGREKSYSGLDEQYSLVETIFDTPSRHFTYIFNVFVMLQVFNFLNCRKIRDEANVLEGITRNYLFISIVICIFIGQIIIVTFGNISFYCYNYYGLRVEQWLITIAFGVSGLLLNHLLRILPEDKLIWFNLGWDELAVKPKDEDDEDGDRGSGDENAQLNVP